MSRFVLLRCEYIELEPLPDDAPPPSGPTVRIMGPDHDDRWVAVWYHRGEQKQCWGRRAEVTSWALAQPAERWLIGVDDVGWPPSEG